MSDRKTCVKCGRTIDRFAKICPFCNWDQNEPVVAKAAPAEGALPAYQPPAEKRWRKPIFGAIGGFLGIIAAFVIGVHVHGNKPPIAPGHEAPVAAPAPAQERPHANVTLVPDAGPAPSIEQPITSAPATESAQGLTNELQRTDATAASSDQYAQMAKRAHAEKQRMAALVDPRSITGAAWGAGAHAGEQTENAPQTLPPAMYSAQRPSVTPAVERTSPIPEYQPLPRVRVRERAVARIALLVGPDGRVHDVSVQRGLGRNTAALINAVQAWRFKPATENGHPVAAPFTVELSFNADE